MHLMLLDNHHRGQPVRLNTSSDGVGARDDRNFAPESRVPTRPCCETEGLAIAVNLVQFGRYAIGISCHIPRECQHRNESKPPGKNLQRALQYLIVEIGHL
ncbi:unnamed protein product [Ectocarpus sp. 12 AP-2014]